MKEFFEDSSFSSSIIDNHMIATSKVIDWRLILPPFTSLNRKTRPKNMTSNQEHHEKKLIMSIQEHHEKKGQIKCAPTIAHMRHCQPHDCNVRSNRLETNPSLFYLFKSRAPRKKGSICQFKSTMKTDQ